MPNDQPNILLITTDQQRGDCLGIDPDGPACLQTPNLDWIGRSGTHFRRGYAECPSCIPARRGIMTGTAPAANGMVGYTGAPVESTAYACRRIIRSRLSNRDDREITSLSTT